MSETLYLYAVVPAAATARLALAGLDGAPVQAILEGPLAALVHRATERPYEGSDETVQRWLLEHLRVTEQAWEEADTVLPSAFNVLVRGEGGDTAEARLRSWLQRERDRLLARLEALRGRAELTVRVLLPVAAAADQDPEVRSLREKMASKTPGVQRLLETRIQLAQRRAAGALADRLYPEVRGRVVALVDEVEERRQPGGEGEVVPVFTAAVLVARAQVEPLGVALGRLQAEHPELQVDYLGPWPPYSFAEWRVERTEREGE